MNAADYVGWLIAVVGLGLTFSGGIIGWVLSHGSRLRAAEVRIENLQSNAESDRRRSDAASIEINRKLDRIEDLVSRKADRRDTDK